MLSGKNGLAGRAAIVRVLLTVSEDAGVASARICLSLRDLQDVCRQATVWASFVEQNPVCLC